MLPHGETDYVQELIDILVGFCEDSDADDIVVLNYGKMIKPRYNCCTYNYLSAE